MRQPGRRSASEKRQAPRHSVSTLRDWADANRVPVLRTPTGYRRFDPDDIEWLRRKMAGKLDPEEEESE
jgi:hypothetical protein